MQKKFLSFYSGKIALIHIEKEKISIEHVRTLPEDVKPLYILRPLLQDQDVELISGLETHDVCLRSLTLQLKSRREILAALPFQIETLLPFAKEDLILLPTFFPNNQETEVFLLASSKKTVANHLEMLSYFDFEPDIISCVPLALFRFARHFFPEHPSLFIHCNDTFVIIKDGKFQASQYIKGSDQERIYAFYLKKYPDINHMLSFGNEKPPSPLIPLEIENPRWIEYAIPIGLGLDAAKDDAQSGQFRKDGRLSKKNKEKRKKQFFTYLVACSCFILITHFMGQIHLNKREKEVLRAIGVETKIPLKQAASQLENSLHQPKKSLIPLAAIPKVHEVLAWLSNHPKLSNLCSITHLKYQIIKAPKLGSQIKTFDIKVELEFTSQSPKAAREFHEALLKDLEMVNHKMDVHWSADHGIYRAVFHLNALKSVENVARKA